MDIIDLLNVLFGHFFEFNNHFFKLVLILLNLSLHDHFGVRDIPKFSLIALYQLPFVFQISF